MGRLWTRSACAEKSARVARYLTKVATWLVETIWKIRKVIGRNKARLRSGKRNLGSESINRISVSETGCVRGRRSDVCMIVSSVFTTPNSR